VAQSVADESGHQTGGCHKDAVSPPGCICRNLRNHILTVMLVTSPISLPLEHQGMYRLADTRPKESFASESARAYGKLYLA
jgi:hypothetical protein